MTASSTQLAVTVTAAVATTGIIPYGDAKYGNFTVETGATLTGITWYGSADGVHYQAMQDDDGALVQAAVVSKAYAIPTQLAGARFLKPVGDAAATLLVNVKDGPVIPSLLGGAAASLPSGNLILNAPISSNVYTGGGRSFNGSDEYFSRAAHASHNLGTGDVLLSGMVQRGADGNKVICGKYQDADNYWKLEFDSSNRIHFIAVKAGVIKIDLTGTTVITSTTAWNHVAVVLDRSSLTGCKIYLNDLDDTGPYSERVIDGMSVNHGTMTGFGNVNTARTTDVPVNCPVSQSIVFDGTDDYINCGSWGTQTQLVLTISCWLKTTKKNSRFVSTRNGVGLLFEFFCDSADGYLTFLPSSGGAHSSTSAVIDNVWYHGAVVINGAASKMYLDGSDILSFSPTMNSGSYGTMCFGTLNFGDHYFSGSLADVRIYDVALSADNILYIATNGASGTAPAVNPVSKWIGYDLVTSAADIDNTGAFQLGANGNGALFFQGSLATFGIAKPTDVTAITAAAVLSLYNFRNGKTYSNITPTERTAWNITSYYDLDEISGNAVERVAAITLTDNNTVGAGNGPAEAIAQDSVGTNHGQLLGKTAAAQIVDWTAVTPDGSYTATVTDGQSTNHGTMAGFADVDAARTTDVSPLCAVSQSICNSSLYSRIDLTSVVSLLVTTGESSLSFWFKTTFTSDLSESGMLISRDNVAGRYLRFRTTTCEYADTNSQKVFDFTLVANKWYHCTLSIKAGTGRAYIDGVESVTGALTGFVDSDFNYIMKYLTTAYGARTFGGSLADFRVYGIELTADNALYLATNGASGTVPASNPVLKLIGYDTPRTDAATADGYGLILDGTDDYVAMGNVGNVTAVDMWVKCLAANQELMTLEGTADGAVTVVLGTLTFGGDLDESNIEIDEVVKTAAAAGALLNDGAWHRLQFDLTSIAASDLRIGTDGTAFGNIVVDELKLNAGVLGQWKFDDGAQSNPLTGDPILAHRSIVGDWYFLQDSVAKRPLYDSAGMNSRPTIEFNGSSKLLYSTQVAKATQQGCVSLAIKPAAVDAAMAFFALTDITGDVDYCYLGLTAAGKLIIKSIIGGTTTSVTGGTTLVVDERVVVQFWSDGTTRGIALNGVAETLTPSGTDTGAWFGDVVSPDYWSLGALKSATEALYFNGEIAHYIGYDDETTAYKRGRMYRYLRKLYKLGA